MKTNLRLFLYVTLLGLIILGIYGYFSIWIPNAKIRNLAWLETASGEEQRLIAHQILSWPFGNHHDAYLVLIRHGSDESIPYLLEGLKGFSDTDFIECSHDHCLEALKKITKKDYGLRYADWKRQLN